MKKIIERLDEKQVEFVKKCAAESVNATVEALDSRIRKREFVIARYLVMKYFKDNTESSLNIIGEDTFGQDHATVFYAVKKINEWTDTDDKIFLDIEAKFNELIECEEMEQLMKEAERRQKLREEESADKQEELKQLHDYQRNYRKVCAKLIRTEEMMPEQRDLDLLNHILNY